MWCGSKLDRVYYRASDRRNGRRWCNDWCCELLTGHLQFLFVAGYNFEDYYFCWATTGHSLTVMKSDGHHRICSPPPQTPQGPRLLRCRLRAFVHRRPSRRRSIHDQGGLEVVFLSELAARSHRPSTRPLPSRHPRSYKYQASMERQIAPAECSWYASSASGSRLSMSGTAVGRNDLCCEHKTISCVLQIHD